MVDGAFVGEGRAPGEERRVHDVAVADDPPDVGCRPPDFAGPEAEAPSPHASDVDGVAAVRVDGELGFRGRSGSRQDESRLVRFHRNVIAALVRAAREKVVPRDVAAGPHGNARGGSVENDDVFDGVRFSIERAVHDALQRNVLSLSIGHVRGEHEARAARADPVAQRALSEAGENHYVDRADPDGREHQ